jgi:hypothetical protein
MAYNNTIAMVPSPDGLLSLTSNNQLASFAANPYLEAIVEDVILDHTHEEYSPSGINVGSVKVRIFSENGGVSSDLIGWANPLDTHFSQLPLIGELVIILFVLGNGFYMRKTPLTNKLQEDSMLNLNKILQNRLKLGKAAISKINEISLTKDAHKFGKYFKPDSRVRQLKHFEGDILVQGRMGHSIRFGSSQMQPGNKGMAPNLILRVGQGKGLDTEECTTPYIHGLILEDINKDASSIWMTSDQALPFVPATANSKLMYRSIKNPITVFDKASIVMNSDKVIMNSKKTHIMLFSNDEVYINSFNRSSIDAGENISLTANVDIEIKSGRNINSVVDFDFTLAAGSDISMLSVDTISMFSKKVYIGSSQSQREPMVGGTSLSVWLARLINVLMGTPPLSILGPQIPGQPYLGIPIIPVPGVATVAHTIGAMGPNVLNPLIVAGLVKLYTELVLPNFGSTIKLPFTGAPFNSLDNYVSIINENPELVMVKNNFKKGTQIPFENNKWELSDKSYYKVV